MKITKAQRTILHRALKLQKHHGADGLFPRGGQYRSVRILTQLGLMRFVGHGSSIDGETEADVPIWEATDKARELLEDSDDA